MKTEVERLAKELEEVKKQKDNETYWHKHYENVSKEANTELEQVHTLLDVFEEALPRKKDDNYTEHSAMTRIASWLVNKK